MLAALFFAQAILVAEACLLPAPTMPFAAQAMEQGEHPASGHACDQSESMDANACLANFTRDDQAANAFAQLAVDALPAAMATLLPPENRAPRPVAEWLTHASPPEPPPSLRFCSLQL